MQPARKTLVHLMHADPVVNAGLHAILSVARHLALTSCARHPMGLERADVVVADYRSGLLLCQLDGNTAARSQRRVLIMTQYEKEWEVRKALEAGVCGYVLQSCVAGELVKAIDLLGTGEHYLSSALRCGTFDPGLHAVLTRRETDVLALLAKGHCNKLIARELGIGLGTVKTHIKQIMLKLHATARTHAVVVATQRGLVGSDLLRLPN